MKRLLLVILITFSFFTLGQEKDANTLTIRNSAKEEQSSSIKSITKTSLPSSGGIIITIEAESGDKCIIPLNKVIRRPVVKPQECIGCNKSYEGQEDYYTQFFLNSVKPNITCDVVNDETVGYHFLGATTVNDKSSFNSSGMVFEMVNYSEGPFYEKEKGPSALDDVFKKVGNVLLWLL